MSQIVPGVSGFPLAPATRIHCTDPRLAERAVGSLIEPRRLAICGNPRATDIRISHVAIGQGHLFGASHGAAVLATSAPIRSYQVMVPLAGQLVGCTPRGRIVADPGQALVYSPRDALETYWSEHCVSLVLSVPAEKLRALAREAHPCADASTLVLRPLMQLRAGSGRSFANALGTLCQEATDPDSAFSRGITTASLERTLLLSLLAAQAAFAPALPAAGRNCRQEAVGRALALIHARAGDEIGSEDLLAAAGVSARTLQTGFMERFGVGPLTYLRQYRLRRIHDVLSHSRPGACTVADVAAQWGFYNGSAFARAYKALFGELPSQTLSAGR